MTHIALEDYLPPSDSDENQEDNPKGKFFYEFTKLLLKAKKEEEE